MPISLPDVLTGPQTAEVLGVSLATLSRWVRQGVISPMGRRNPLLKRQAPYRFRREEVERLLEPFLAAV